MMRYSSSRMHQSPLYYFVSWPLPGFFDLPDVLVPSMQVLHFQPVTTIFSTYLNKVNFFEKLRNYYEKRRKSVLVLTISVCFVSLISSKLASTQHHYSCLK